jgi:integrase
MAGPALYLAKLFGPATALPVLVPDPLSERLPWPCLGIKAHAHMLRHACGYALANAGHDTRALQAYLGHRNIQNTTRYTALAPDRFKGFWKD